MKRFSPKLRKLLSLAIACCLLLTVVGPIAALAEDTSGHWAASDINLLKERNIVRGDDNGNINPDNNITRAEFVAIINRAFSLTEKDASNFPDVAPGSWYFDDFAIAKKAGNILGDENGNANPESPITRAEVSVILSRVLKLEPASDTSTFADSASFPDWSAESIIAMTESGLVNGYPDNTFRATNNITRAEAFTILARIIKNGLLGGGDDTPAPTETPAPTATPAPTSPPSGGGGGGGGGSTPPRITVATVFPSGVTTQNAIDVAYTATPGSGATVSEVYYTINGGAEEYIYLVGGNGIAPKGTLGTGVVLLIPGENNIVFTVKDSAGRTASFTVQNKPNYDFGTPPGDDDDDDNIGELADGSGVRFYKNRIVIFAQLGVTESQMEEIAETLDGEIISVVRVLDMYTIRLPDQCTEAELTDLCEELLATFPTLIEGAYLALIEDIVGDATAHTNDPWWENNQWGLTAIGVPEVWSTYGNLIRNIKIGVVDNGFRANHEDLQIPAGNVFNRNLADDDHGTHVMGTIGAVQNNNKGLAGLVDANRNSLYGYDSFDSRDTNNILGGSASVTAILEGLAWDVTHGAKVINFSMGANYPVGATNTQYARAMRKLLQQGYDFVIVHSAGNSTINANRNGVWAFVTEAELRARIITVGASDVNGNITSFSNYGARVDVLAPGANIYSSIATDDSAYASYSGTSMAAPHVTGVAALVWAANPGLSGAQVKQIILDSANQYGLAITDARTAVPQADRLTYHQVNAKAAVEMAIDTEPVLTAGQLAGQVIAARADGTDGPAIAGAKISLYSGITDPELTSTVSDSEGHYVIRNIAAGRYYLIVAAEGYIPERFFVQIEAGVTTYIHRLSAVPVSTENGTVSGEITNAYTGARVTDSITLQFRRGIDYNPAAPGEIVETVTTSAGTYSVVLPAGNYTVSAQGDGYIATVAYVYSYGGHSIANQNVVISPAFSGGDSSVRIVLSWGALPSDLDSHLVGPTPDGNRFHVYYVNKVYRYTPPGGTQQMYANLDVDDVTSYGPETVTIDTLVDGQYDYYIHDYTNRYITTSDFLRNSQAVVRIYSSDNELLRAFNVPTGGGASTIWHVFSLSVVNGQYTIVPVNTMRNVPTSPDDIGGPSFSDASDESIAPAFAFAAAAIAEEVKLSA